MLQSLQGAATETRATDLNLLQIIGGLIVLPIVALTLLSLRWEIFHDASLMYFIGREISWGARTVFDVFDMNMPLVHWMHAGIYSVFGLSALAWRMLDLAVVATISVAGYALIRPLAGQFAIGGVIWILARHNFTGPMIVGQRDVMMLAIVLCAALALLRSAERGRNLRFSFLAGILLGLAVMLKPTAAVFPPLMAAALFLTVPRLRNVSTAAAEFGVLIAGCAIPCIAGLAALWMQGNLIEFVEIWTRYLVPAYGRIRFGFYAHLEPLLAVLIPSAVIVACAGIARIRIALEPRVAMLAAVALASFIGYVAQGKGWSYQAAPFNYSVILLVAVAAHHIALRGGRTRKVLIGLVTAASLWPMLVLYALFFTEVDNARAGDDWPPPVTAQMIQDLDNVIDRSRPVQIMDTTDGGIDALLRTGRRQPSRFIYDFQFYIGEQTAYRARLREEFLAKLEAAGEHALLVTNQQWPGDRGFDRVDDARLWPELNRLITTKYKLVSERSRDLPHGKQYRIYRYSP